MPASGKEGVDSRSRLPGREAFYRDLQPLLERLSEQEGSLVLLSTEIQGLDFVLRTFGPEERDSMIAEIGKRLREASGTGTTPYHITHGCFSLLLENGNYNQATEHAKAITRALQQPFEVAGVAYHLRANVGISHYPNHAETINGLVRTSAFACHLARESRSDFASFDRSLDEWERHRFRLLVDLEKALAAGSEPTLAYQPLVNLANGRCEGVEGLCRWQHPQFGSVAPGDFIPYVEQTPLMMPLTEATLGIGLDSLSRWRGHGFDGSIAINISTSLFRLPDFMDRLSELFRFYNISPEAVHFEITETGIMEQPNHAINLLKRIRDWGCKISVDDFGTGYSSLAYLADLPIDIIKIDKHFVQNLDKPWGEAIVGATATLADKLGLQTVGEGIEDERQYEKCRELGVTFGQGYFIGRPMTRKQFEEWVGAHLHAPAP